MGRDSEGPDTPYAEIDGKHHYTELDLDGVRKLRDALLDDEKKFGNYTVKYDLRQSGFSMHVKFENKMSVAETQEIASHFADAADKLYLLAIKLVGADE